MNNPYIKDNYKFKEINRLMKLTLDDKIQIAVDVIGEALRLSRHTAAIAFSGGKDSEVVADLIERHYPAEFEDVHCIFGNTGIEFPESLHFARKYGVEHFGERFHETKLLKLEEDELRYDFARYIVSELEEEGALDEILKPDGKLKGQKALINAAVKRGYELDSRNCFFKGHTMNFAYCIEQYGAPLLGKASSKLDAHRINIECFLKYSESATDKDKLKEYYGILRECKFSQHCCKLLKKAPSEKIQAELDVDMIFKGLMASESHSRLTSFAVRGHIYASHRPHITDGAFYHVNPLGLWTDDDIWEYIHRFELDYSPLYDITYTAADGSTQHIKRNGCIMCGTDIQYKDNHLAILRQTHPKAWESCMNHFGYREQLYTLFKKKKNMNIYNSFTDEGTNARMIERFGSAAALFDVRPCAYDDFGELVDLSGTGLDREYDAEVLLENSGQLRFV
ncbi:MAG: phosphoadenosine phosphosulfate reductase family protein [Ruminococcus sp.]|nr:phosphoadenosine phosphosulfate reductase family protein [Ruminococcus sp.]